MAEMRPLIAAEPILRAPKPEIVAEVYGVFSAWQRMAQRTMAEGRTNFRESMNVKGKVIWQRENEKTRHQLAC
jgi:hypothetical protein